MLKRIAIANSHKTSKWLTRAFRRDHVMGEVDVLSVSPEYDERTNRDTTPPADEHLDFRCIWGIECYTSSQFQRLEDVLSELGWRELSAPDAYSDPVLWLRQLRGSRFSGGSLNLGYVATDGGPSFVGGTRFVSTLPKNVKYGLGWIECLSPSLVALSLCFILDEDLSAVVDELLRRDRTSYHVPTPAGFAIHDARVQKHSDYEEFRRELQASIADWFSQYIPGVFASTGRETPTCELVTANLGRPHIKGEGQSPDPFSYIPIVGFVAGLDSWRSSSVPGLLLDIPINSWHALAVVNDADLKAAVSGETRPSRERTAHWMDDQIGSILRLWAVVPLLEHLVRTNDGELIPLGENPEKAMEILRRGAISRVDVSALSTELTDELSEERWMRRAGGRFQRAILRTGSSESLAEVLVYLVRRKAAWLLGADRAAREMLGLYGSLLGSVENIRLQRSIRRLTWFLALLAVLAVLSPVVAAKCL